jgi:hypothetical protein
VGAGGNIASLFGPIAWLTPFSLPVHKSRQPAIRWRTWKYASGDDRLAARSLTVENSAYGQSYDQCVGTA